MLDAVRLQYIRNTTRTVEINVSPMIRADTILSGCTPLQGAIVKPTSVARLKVRIQIRSVCRIIEIPVQSKRMKK